ncbi:MAG: serine/threonine protein kinase, partial [Planctomycetota bacterium]|nr:serine/threonine protein kinase [Planctomycetota bacterium]
MAVGDSDPGSTIPQPGGLGPATPRPSSHAFGSGASAGSSWSSANLSVAPEDLSGERMLRDATKMPFEQRQVPSLGGIMLLAKLGQGGMGAVYYGVHPRLRTEVAVKVLPFHLADRNPELVNRFVREAQIAAQIKSPHLVGVTDVNEENGLFYLVMEFVRGTSAGSYLKKIKAGGGAGLSEGEALDICVAAVTGLAAAHMKGIIHRDIKPDNVLIPAVQGGTLDMKECKLADLGLARGEESGQSLTGTQAVMGTPGYMAPEQGMDARKAGKPADVFSVGAMLYALLCGNAPFRDGPALAVIFKAINEPHEPLSTYRPDVSPGTLALIDRCLAKHPQERYADASALLEALKVCRSALGA